MPDTKKINDGGRAFPRPIGQKINSIDGEHNWDQDGMSLGVHASILVDGEKWAPGGLDWTTAKVIGNIHNVPYPPESE